MHPVEQFLRLREYAYAARRVERMLPERIAQFHQVALDMQRPDLAAKVTAHAAKLQEIAQQFPSDQVQSETLLAAVNKARVITFEGLSQDDLMLIASTAAAAVGAPDSFDRLPFAACYFAFGAGVVIETDAEKPWRMCGLLVVREGHVWTVALDSAMKHSSFYPSNVCAYGAWVEHAVAVAGMLDILLDLGEAAARPSTLGPLALRRRLEAAIKAGVPPIRPPPYYVITPHATRVHDVVAAQTAREHAYRWDVRQHVRKRFLRGLGAIDPDTAAIFLERGYAVVFDASLDADLVARGLAPWQPDEWIAVKTWPVRNHIKGPEAAPYVPALRRVPALAAQE